MKGWNIIWLSLGLFFAYHVGYGPRSYSVYVRLQGEKREYQTQAQTCKDEYAQWARLVHGMKSPLDPDVLEQQAWSVAGYVHEDEEVYFPSEASAPVKSMPSHQNATAL